MYFPIPFVTPVFICIYYSEVQRLLGAPYPVDLAQQQEAVAELEREVEGGNAALQAVTRDYN